ncbi:AT-hook motif nuclear-localized protein 10-like protein [Tanacetum coccineum]
MHERCMGEVGYKAEHAHKSKTSKGHTEGEKDRKRGKKLLETTETKEEDKKSLPTSKELLEGKKGLRAKEKTKSRGKQSDTYASSSSTLILVLHEFLSEVMSPQITAAPSEGLLVTKDSCGRSPLQPTCLYTVCYIILYPAGFVNHRSKISKGLLRLSPSTNYSNNPNGTQHNYTPVMTSPTEGSTIDVVKRKRGRPRKYPADVSVSPLMLPPPPGSTAAAGDGGYSSPAGMSNSGKKRGRPPGCLNKQHHPAASGSPGVGFMPHILDVKAGEVHP